MANAEQRYKQLQKINKYDTSDTSDTQFLRINTLDVAPSQ